MSENHSTGINSYAKSINFQILIDTAGYKQYSIGNLQGSYLVTIKNINLQNAGAEYIIRLKSNILVLDSGSPTNDILFHHIDTKPSIINPLYCYAQLQTWIDFTVTDYATGLDPVGFQYILLHCEATKCQ